MCVFMSTCLIQIRLVCLLPKVLFDFYGSLSLRWIFVFLRVDLTVPLRPYAHGLHGLKVPLLQSKNGVFKREMQRDRPALVPLITRSTTWLQQQAVTDDRFGWQHNQAVCNFDFYAYACSDLCALACVWIFRPLLDLSSRG